MIEIREQRETEKMTWHEANEGAERGWRLPSMGELRLIGNNLTPGTYWSGSEYAPFPYDAWGFLTYYGGQDHYDKGNQLYAWFVRDVKEITE